MQIRRFALVAMACGSSTSSSTTTAPPSTTVPSTAAPSATAPAATGGVAFTMDDHVAWLVDGQVFQRSDGDTLTLPEYAGPMISISDNTATDHLIDRLGRESIEAAMTRGGVTDPTLNQPFLATREVFWLKYSAQEPNPSDWYDTDVAGRRDILDSPEGRTVPWVDDPRVVAEANADGVPLGQPRNLDIEYFASPQDLCRTLVHLDELASTPGLEPVADILSLNPGVPLDPDTWTDVRFKGGSEPGVVALAWWLGRSDGRQFVVAGALNDPDVAFDQIAAIQLITNAIGLISRHSMS